MSSNNNAMDASLDDARFASVAPISDDWYHGHKVVAMPSSAFGGMSIREVVSSRNESEQQANGNGSRPRRSNSLGRQPIRPGRDIIQDVYDRMGVSYTRGINYEATPPRSSPDYEDQQVPMGIQTAPSFSEVSDFSTNSSAVGSNLPTGGPPPAASRSSGKIKDKFSGRYRAAAAMTRTTPDRGRARPADPAMQNRGRAAEPRGRAVDPSTDEHESEGRRRARSLSRGLSVRGIWPPPKDQGQIMDYTPVSSGNKSHSHPKNQPTVESCRNPPPPPPPLPPPQQQLQQQQQQQQPQTPSSPNRPKSPLKRSHSFDARPQYGGGFRTPQSTAAMHNNKMRAPQTAPPMDMSGSIRDEKKDGDDRSAASEASGAEDVSAPTSLPSIKDRISAFAGKSNAAPSQRNAGRRNTYAGTSYNAKPPPPKVDIYNQTNSGRNDDMMVGHYSHPDDPNNYDESGGTEVTADDYVQQQPGPPEPSSIPPSAAATAAADAAAKYMRPSQVVLSKKAASRHSTGSARSSIANSYLSGIQSSTSNATTTTAASSRSCFQPSMSDGSANGNYGANEDTGGGYNNNTDGNSVGATSSTSYGDAGSVGRSRPSWQKPSSAYGSQNNMVNKSNGMSNSGPHATGTDGGENMSMEMIERMVDERVQVQLREVEARMEGLLRRWMDSMNSKITSRLDAMERSIKESLPRHEI